MLGARSAAQQLAPAHHALWDSIAFLHWESSGGFPHRIIELVQSAGPIEPPSARRNSIGIAHPIYKPCGSGSFNMSGVEKLSTVRGFLLDMDGTFYLSDRLLEGALRFIDVLREQGKEFLFLTNNSSKQGRQYAEKITRLGLPLGEESVLTSGEATAMYLNREHRGADIFLMGTPYLEDEFRRHGFRLVEDNPEFLVLGFDQTLTYKKLWQLCDFVRAGVPYIATHPDFNCPTETGWMPDVGAMIAFVKAATGREPDLVVGKPNRLIVDAAAAKMNLQVSDLAMIGDRLYTDIALGQASGIVTVLVLSGETKVEDLKDSPFRPDYTFQNLAGVADWLDEHCQSVAGGKQS